MTGMFYLKMSYSKQESAKIVHKHILFIGKHKVISLIYDTKQNDMQEYDSPILLFVVLKIIHVTTRGLILCVHFLANLRFDRVNKVSAVLHDEIAPTEVPGGHDAPAFIVKIPNLEKSRMRSCLVHLKVKVREQREISHLQPLFHFTPNGLL